MNDYSCCYYLLNNNRLFKNINSACWAGFNCLSDYRIDNEKVETSYEKFKKSFIFIEYDYYGLLLNDDQLEKYVKILNNFIYCKLKKRKNKKYLVIKLNEKLFKKNLNQGNHNYRMLLILNFIRMIWYKPRNFKYNEFLNELFQTFYDLKGDPLYKFLTILIKHQFEESPYGWGDHSCIFKNSKPKTLKQLYNWDNNSMQGFLDY